VKLRTRLYVGLGAVALTFAIAGYLVANNQRRYLNEQIDQQLDSAAPFAVGVLRELGGGVPPPPPDTNEAVPRQPTGPQISDLFIGHLAADGTLTPVLTGQLISGSPIVDLALATAKAPSAGQRPTPFTVDGAGTSDRFRAVVLHRADNDGWDVIALPMTRADDAYRRLLLAGGFAGLLVLAAIGITALWVVRLGVKPINDMAAAADAITAGDHDRRVGTFPAGTEADRLANALNAMLDERQASDRRLRQFVTDASHELRTPLTSIRGYVDLYGAGGLRGDGALDDAMRRVSAESQRMGALVDDLLLLSQLDSGVTMQHEPVDLAILIDDAVADARAVQPARTIELQLIAGPLQLVGDARRLHQVLAALLHNALVHTPVETPIEVVAASHPGSIVVDVIDHGPGMDATTAAQAFERFTRSDASRSRHNGGAGLGLAIATSIAEAHAGTLTLATAPGAGCRFRLALPADS
jgi:two-component system, OmpR family, sensor kinase